MTGSLRWRLEFGIVCGRVSSETFRRSIPSPSQARLCAERNLRDCTKKKDVAPEPASVKTVPPYELGDGMLRFFWRTTRGRAVPGRPNYCRRVGATLRTVESGIGANGEAIEVTHLPDRQRPWCQNSRFPGCFGRCYPGNIVARVRARSLFDPRMLTNRDDRQPLCPVIRRLAPLVARRPGFEGSRRLGDGFEDSQCGPVLGPADQCWTAGTKFDWLVQARRSPWAGSWCAEVFP